MSAPVILDNIEKDILKRHYAEIQSTFKKYIFLVLVIDFVLISITTFYIVFWWNVGWVWDLFLRFPTLLRMFCLSIVLCMNINVYKILGAVPKFNKILRHFFEYKPLAIWMIIGYMDIILRFLILLIDLVGLSAIVQRFVSFQTLAYLPLDVMYILEFWISVNLIYYKGVYWNIIHHLHMKFRENGNASAWIYSGPQISASQGAAFKKWQQMGHRSAGSQSSSPSPFSSVSRVSRPSSASSLFSNSRRSHSNV
jgi:hypothetical protein